tara:strand:+ start:7927 stop:10845 length:2919 start_codon:yes stop_codon:yes gene_type:complete
MLIKLILKIIFGMTFWSFYICSAQEIPRNTSGIIPKITHYSRNDFHADGQFWTMTEDKNGILYFGNNDGVLVFDGERWQKVTLPNHSTVRSLITTTDNVVHAGGFNQIGTIDRDSLGNYFYNSQNEQLKLDNEKIENLWQVHDFRGYLIYRSFTELIVVTGSTATHIQANNRFIQSGVVGDHYYVQDMNFGIMEFDPQSMSLKKSFQFPENEGSVVAFLPTNQENELLIVTKSGVILKADRNKGKLTELKNLFNPEEQEQIISAKMYKNDYLLGTLSSKLMILRQNGELIRKPSSFLKLFNSTILDVQSSQDENSLWVLMNNGLDYVEFNSPVSHLFDSSSISDIYLDKDTLYLATNTGVFYSKFDISNYDINTLNFEKVQNLEGQSWSITKQKGKILISHDKGLFYLDKNKPVRIGGANGIWKVIPVQGKSNTFIAASYYGLYPLTFTNGSWILNEKIKGFNESGRDILQVDANNTFWVCHGYKGVYRLKLNDNLSRVFALEHFTDKNGLQSPFNVNVTNWNDTIIFTTNTGIYTFDSTSTKFIPYKPLNDILDPKFNTRKIIQNDSRVWFVEDDEVGYFDNDSENKELHKNLFLNLKGSLNRGMESIWPLSKSQVLIGSINGLFLYDTKESSQNLNPATILTSITYTKKQNQKSKPLPLHQKADLNDPIDILRFEFAAPQLTPSSEKEFQYKLEGVDNEWSNWDSNAFKEYTHPHPGTYTFKVRARNLIGQAADETSFNFTIPPPWYQTNVAFVFYLILFTGLTALTVYLISQKIERERQKEKQAAKKSKKLLQLEIEQLKLEQDKARIKKHKQELEEDNLTKSKELANYTMLLVKKKEIFTDTYNALKDFKNSLKTQAARKRLQEVLFNLNQHRMGEEYLNVFDIHFEKVHENFFHQLKEIDTTITKRELRLCAFVKMNLTNKEIAPLLNISVRGVETARYRIRKKLNVKDENLTEFLENITAFSESGH